MKPILKKYPEPKSIIVKCILFSILLLSIVSPVFAGFSTNPVDVGVYYNTSTQIASSVAPNTTPWELWICAGLLGLGLFLYSIRPAKSTDELEMSILVSVMAWISIGYCAYSSFAIDRIEGYGVTSFIANNTTSTVYMSNHIIYSEPVVGILMAVLFFVSVVYTFYRVASHKSLLGGEE